MPRDAVLREVQEELGVRLSGPLGAHSFSRTTEDFELRAWTARSLVRITDELRTT